MLNAIYEIWGSSRNTAHPLVFTILRIQTPVNLAMRKTQILRVSLIGGFQMFGPATRDMGRFPTWYGARDFAVTKSIMFPKYISYRCPSHLNRRFFAPSRNMPSRRCDISKGNYTAAYRDKSGIRATGVFESKKLTSR